MDDIVSFGEEEKPKQKRTRKKKVVISENEEYIIRQLKKDRIFSKVNKTEVGNLTSIQKLEFINKQIDNLLLQENDRYIYIIDKLYEIDRHNFLFLAADAFSFVINDDIVYNELKNRKEYNLTGKTKLYFYDINGLTEYNNLTSED